MPSKPPLIMNERKIVKVYCPDEFFEFIRIHYGAEYLHQIDDTRFIVEQNPEYIYIGDKYISAAKKNKLISLHKQFKVKDQPVSHYGQPSGY